MRSVTFGLIAMLLAAPAAAEHDQVDLLGGQSNGNGRADAAQLEPPLSEIQRDVHFYYRNIQDENSVLPQDRWIHLAPGAEHGTRAYFPVEFGPEVAFGRAMADARLDARIAIIKYTYGGTNLFDHGSATGAHYAVFLSTVRAALEVLTAGGDTYELRGMLWQQGESDARPVVAEAYRANLEQLIARIRLDLNAGVAIPFVIGSLSDRQYRTLDRAGSGPWTVRRAQEAVAAADVTVGIVISDGFGILPDGIHFDHQGQAALGRGHARAMLALEGHDR